MAAPFVKQLWVVCGVLLNALGQGMMLSYPASLLPALLATSGDIRVDLDTASWLASSVGLSSLIGFLASSYCMDSVGRRATFALAIAPGALAWLLIYFANGVPLLLLGRIFGGISGGATVTLGAILLGEYTSPENRGMFLNLKSAAVCIGNTTVHVLNFYMDWRKIALVALLPFVTAFFIACSMDESPSWLASKGYFEKSEVVFFNLRSRNERTRQEFDKLIESQKDVLSKSSRRSKSKIITNFIGNFRNKQFWKPMFIIVVSAVLSEFSGRHIFPAYAPQIIGEITGDKTESFYYTLSIDLIITSSVTISSVLVKIMRRRVLLLSTGLLSLTVLISVCTYLFLSSKDLVSTDKPWIPLSLLIVYFVLANLCCTPFPFIIIGEVMPLAHKGSLSAITGVFLSLLLMTALKISPYMFLSLKVYGTFAIYSVIAALCLVLMYFILPETKDRSLPEIESYFCNGTFDVTEVESVKRKMIQ